MKSALSQNGPNDPMPDVLRFRAVTVTGSQELPVEVGADASVRSVAESIAVRMQLPGDVPWALRDDSNSVYLDDDRPIGDQLDADARVAIAPRTHLGG